MTSIYDRFLAKCQYDEATGCVLWTGQHTHDGYGLFKVNYGPQKAHRASYVLFVGPIPDGYEVDHLCFVRDCVRHDHLEAVTPKTNSERRAALVTHCPQGHEYNPENTYTWNGHRRCRVCHNQVMKKQRRERRRK